MGRPLRSGARTDTLAARLLKTLEDEPLGPMDAAEFERRLAAIGFFQTGLADLVTRLGGGKFHRTRFTELAGGKGATPQLVALVRLLTADVAGLGPAKREDLAPLARALGEGLEGERREALERFARALHSAPPERMGRILDRLKLIEDAAGVTAPSDTSSDG